MQLFDLTNTLFSNPKKWATVTRGDKKKNHFLINRMMSIQYPLQAQFLNHVKIDPVATVDFWQNFMRKIYSRTPGWMYTKGQKKRKEAKEKKLDIKQSTVKEFAKTYKLDYKSVQDAITFFPEEMKKEFKAFEKLIKG